jgi:predicted ATPase
MEGKKLLHSITLKNLLSYGSEGMTLDLEPLNVLIGPNSSGKSNLIEAVSLLAATPRDLAKPLRMGGGTEEWLWKGSEDLPVAELAATIDYPAGSSLLYYNLMFTAVQYRLAVVGERIDDVPELPPAPKDPIYEFEGGEAFLLSRANAREGSRGKALRIPARDLDLTQSILSQRRDPQNYPELTYLGVRLKEIAFFRDWTLGRESAARQAQSVDLPNDFLLEDSSNLGLVLNDLQNRLEVRRRLLEALKPLYERIEDVTTKIQGGAIQILCHEKGLKRPVPASCLSDGTLHYLSLLTILLHPDPPPLICIEEPELGLHPDVIPHVADLLLDASKRTQLIVTTHSETLVSRLSEVPESVVVCERDDRGTQLRRLEPEKLRVWLDKYMLGELWRMGEIGGNRW